ncbi:MAG: hypothetical protein M1834_006086 [Cirrosporium novae-zelandiae]|nr:MAG: hypothetical protein M1834_006086 [Cirrosporium novae-zelandiae]
MSYRRNSPPPQLETKSAVREKVWKELRKVARPDSRFHFDFAEFIADFEGSDQAVNRFTSLDWYKTAQIIFITPDNCLEGLRLAALKDGKRILMTTYAIRRGFWLIDPKTIPVEHYQYAATLDGMEKFGRPIKLVEIIKETLTVDLMVTGTGAINADGIRFGKGHGFFDLEWAMLYSIGAISTETHTAAIIHDCQLLTERLIPETFDTVCDVVVTPTQVLQTGKPHKPDCGILWDKLAPGMLASIPPLQELKSIILGHKMST